MKRIIRSSFKLVLAFMLVAGFTQQTYASHYQGGDLTYLCVAPGVYVVTGKIYRDCSGAALSTSETLKWQAPGCNTGSTVSMPLVPGSVQTGITLGLYCPASVTQAACNSSATLPNFETGTYRATVTFNATQQNCKDWLFSMRMGNRPTIENIVNGQSAYLYLEAYVNLGDNIIGKNINNNSPEFAPTNIPIPFVCVNTDVTLSMNAAEADGDSLSYHLSTPLDDYNDPETYAANTNGGGSTGFPPGTSSAISGTPYANGACIVYNQTPAPGCGFANNIFTPGGTVQYAVVPASYCTGGGPGGPSGTYSATYPLPVAAASLSWANCATNVQLGPGGFNLDPLTGVIRFKPNVFHQSAPIAGRNKYAVVVQINEWRKINGVMTKVGHIRRDILVIVNNCANTPPGIDVPNPLPITGAIIRQDTVFDVQTCTTTRFMIKHTDGNPTDLLNVEFPGAAAIPGTNGNLFNFPGINGTTPIPGLIMKKYTNNQNAVNVAFYMTPNTSAIGQDYYLSSIIKDNACPLPGRLEQVYRIHINSSNRVAPVAGVKDRTICLGDSTPINTLLMRPDSIFSGTAIAPGQYTFNWTETNASGGLPNGLRPADQTKRNIVVKPTQTTRYFLTVTSSITGCRDTTSIIVRVDRSELAKVKGTQDRIICFGDSADISIRPDTIGGLPVAYTYEWYLAPGMSFKQAGLDSTKINDVNITVLPTKTTRYYLRATSVPAIGCPDTASVLVRLNNQLVGLSVAVSQKVIPYRGTSILEVAGTDPVLPYTYEWYSDNPEEVNTVTGIPVILGKERMLKANPLTSANYFVRVINALGCVDTLTARVDVGTYFTNIITPNGDGKNDYLELPNIPANTSVMIYNRWGKLVKEFKNYENKAGKAFDGKDLSDGTYYYYIKQPDGTKVKGWLDIRK